MRTRQTLLPGKGTSFRRVAYKRFLLNCWKYHFRPPQIYNASKYFINKYIFHDNKLSYGPLSVIIFANKTCNLDCWFCYFKSELNSPNSEEFNLTLEKLDKILRHRLIRDSLRIGLTGGEPFLNNQIFDIMARIKKDGHILSVVTNGTLFHKFPERINQSQIDLLSISVYDDTIDKLRENVPLIDERIFKKFHCVVTSDALERIERTIALALELRVQGVMLHNYFPEANTDLNKCVFDDNADYIESKKYLIHKYGNKIAIEWFAPLPRKVGAKKCRMPFYHLQIDSDGNMGPCCFTFCEPKYGNIFKVADPWNREFYINFRSKLISHGGPPTICKYCYFISDDLFGL